MSEDIMSSIYKLKKCEKKVNIAPKKTFKTKNAIF